MRAALALTRSSHPGPTLVVTVVTAVLAVAAGIDTARFALLVSAVFVGQLSVGWCNDAVDARRDAAVGRVDKPVARGEISARTVGIAAVLAAVLALALSTPLGPGMLLAHAIALASAWSYNLGLKNSPISVLPFAVSFGILPSLVTLSLPAPIPAAPWASAAGAALGVAIHFSNVLPDFDDDAATGIRGLPHRIGARASAVTAFVALEAGAAAVFAGPALAGAGFSVASVVGLVVVTGIAIAGLVRALRRPDRTVFRLVMLAAIVLVILLALAGVSVR